MFVVNPIWKTLANLYLASWDWASLHQTVNKNHILTQHILCSLSSFAQSPLAALKLVPVPIRNIAVYSRTVQSYCSLHRNNAECTACCSSAAQQGVLQCTSVHISAHQCIRWYPHTLVMGLSYQTQLLKKKGLLFCQT